MNLFSKLVQSGANYVPDFNFISAHFKNNKVRGKVLCYLIGLAQAYDIEENQILQFESKWGYTAIGCAKQTFSDDLHELYRQNYLTYLESHGSQGTEVILNSEAIMTLFEDYKNNKGVVNQKLTLTSGEQVVNSGLTSSSPQQSHINNNRNDINTNSIYKGNPFPKENFYLNLSKDILSYFSKITNNTYRLDDDNNPNLDIIYDRLKDGYTSEQLKHIIDVLSIKWKDTKYEDFIRPITLFKKDKIDDYLNMKLPEKNKPKVENKTTTANNKAISSKPIENKEFDNDAMYEAALKKIKEMGWG